jgi:short-subunit dehydrogenase
MSRKVLIIGNSDGIGAAVTRALVACGDRVVGISRSPSPLGAAGPRHVIHDVASPLLGELLRLLLEEEGGKEPAKEGGFDACIYCAGIGSQLTLPDLSNESRVFDVNLTGMVRTFEVLAPYWIERGKGHFIGLSSLADDIYSTDAPSYSASKAGFSNYLLSMGLKLRSQNVFVTNIRFGFVDTKMAKSPRRPLMMTADQAAKHVLRCLDQRPLQLSVPKAVGAVAHALRLAQSLRIWTT